jgi:hypothetical protein
VRSRVRALRCAPVSCSSAGDRQEAPGAAVAVLPARPGLASVRERLCPIATEGDSSGYRGLAFRAAARFVLSPPAK